MSCKVSLRIINANKTYFNISIFFLQHGYISYNLFLIILVLISLSLVQTFFSSLYPLSFSFFFFCFVILTIFFNFGMGSLLFALSIANKRYIVYYLHINIECVFLMCRYFHFSLRKGAPQNLRKFRSKHFFFFTFFKLLLTNYSIQ